VSGVTAEGSYAAFDLRLRSIDRKPGEPISLCSDCQDHASWSVWLHTPVWSSDGGLTLVLCTRHALNTVTIEARMAVRYRSPVAKGRRFDDE
jgi:hypothetical protein